MPFSSKTAASAPLQQPCQRHVPGVVESFQKRLIYLRAGATPSAMRLPSGKTEMTNFAHIAGLLAISAGLSAPLAAQAGCLGGAAVGGIAGHEAGHHAVLGAIGGCIVGHHMAVMQHRREAAAAATAQAEQAQQARVAASQTATAPAPAPAPAPH